eukprot:GGOE01013950.1.p1 GENE.GGOE01013950.1~~GGOE01013950.1.p1  ORF type:complete len:286 (-),score=52.85 GGOE01013950.1:401-1213(-)
MSKISELGSKSMSSSAELKQIEVGSNEELELANKLRASLPEDMLNENTELITSVALCCLRYRRYDMATAQERLSKYLLWRKLTFGNLAAHRLAEDEKLLARMDTRFFMVLPDVLPTGDRVALMQLRYIQPKVFSPMVSLKAWHYWIMRSLMESPALQASGIVLIISQEGADLSSFDRRFLARILKAMSKCIPLRLNWILVVRPIAMFRLVLPIIVHLMSSKMRERFATVREFAALQSGYGIPKEILPPDVGGTLDFNISAWVHDRLNEVV